jgi:hypothetical protein
VTGIISIIHLHIKKKKMNQNKYFIRYKIGVFPIAFFGMGKNTQKRKTFRHTNGTNVLRRIGNGDGERLQLLKR